MMDLNNVSEIKKLDKANVLGSIEQLGWQCEQAWNEVNRIKFPPEYRHIQQIVFSAMGGSALGAYVTKSLFFNQLPVPFEIVNDYSLPIYINEKTLVVVNSYSGNTEETVAALKQAVEKKVLIFGSTTGGKLADILTKNKLPRYIYDPKYNPSEQPRMAIGYSIFINIALLNNLGLVRTDDEELMNIKEIINKSNLLYGLHIPKTKNLAKKLAQKLYQKSPIIITGEFLTHVGRVMRNQFHENAKTFAAYHEIPELNHHLMEGLTNPKSNPKNLLFIFIDSPLYSDKIKKRFSITKDIVKKNGIYLYEFFPQAKTKLEQMTEVIHFGVYVNYYLTLLYGLDPSKIPWVDYFKAELAK